ncbi:MAG: ABC transporter ATP-binding protein [Chloroflexi bacterium]|nr:MAG: ABC transporter ATP-binding protein [Chloroflexota bacterium]
MPDTKSSNHTRIDRAEMRGIVKRFPGVLANDHIDFDVHAGEVHALLGENGAGKSTLMKILYGLYQPDEGQILLNGEPVQLTSPADAIRLGIGMIHQHFMLVPSLTVAENVALGLPSSRGLLTDLDRVSLRIQELAGVYGLQVDPAAHVWQLSVGEQQRVEILKTLYRGASLLILDEPTAVLTPQEVDELFVTLRQMARDGHALIFITHKLREVFAISDRVTVLRDGRVVGRVATEETNRSELARMMVGREIIERWEKPPARPGPVILDVSNLHCESDKGTPALRGVSFQVRAGEILGIAGVSGNGQRELAEVIAGLREATAGHIRLAGQDLTNQPPDKIIAAGLAYIPEERLTMGVIQDFSVAENAILETHTSPDLTNGPFLNLEAIRRHTARLIRDYDVRTPGQETPAKNLSGGNIQKLILARELSREPRVLVAAQPTRGVDIGATEYIHRRLIEQRNQGTAILLISEDLDEIQSLSDRIAVMYEGEIVGEVPAEEADVEELGLMMAGASILC